MLADHGAPVGHSLHEGGKQAVRAGFRVAEAL
jgi:hypothetical protein